MEDCIFCKIIDGEMDSEVIYEDDTVIAVLDANPLAPGHAMVLPRFHAENILELEDDMVEPYFQAVRNVVKMIEESDLDPDGFTLGINHGKASGQAIDHLHFHIIPRWKSDEGTSLHGVVNNPPTKSVEEVRDIIIGS